MVQMKTGCEEKQGVLRDSRRTKGGNEWANSQLSP
jgi:hypothetical protein